MISCPYCGEMVDPGVITHGEKVTCHACKNEVLALFMNPADWDRILAKLGIYKFLVRELEDTKESLLVICPICGTPFFGGGLVCRHCEKCPICREFIEISPEGVHCQKCDKQWDWPDFINRKKVLEEKW